MAFWGTARENAWHRRKAKEQEREDVIRNEEQKRLIYVRARHEEELEEKERVLDVLRRLLRDARYESKVAHEDKRRRIKQEENDDDGVIHVSKRQKIKRDDDDQVEQAEGHRGDADAADDDIEVQAEESVRENLLALSYAMFDTLYGTSSFHPKAFCLFLLKKGEKALAEQIALAVIEKSHGVGTHVPFVLEELVPQSDAPEDLVRCARFALQCQGTEWQGRSD